MTKLQRSKLPTVPQLLNHIFENPNLVAGVRELPGPALGKLIRRVGLEDAAELVALATTEQLEQVFDEDLWRVGAEGYLEQFDPARFALWLHAFSEAGEEAVVKRLVELPIDFVTLAIQRLILVIDIDALAVEMSNSRRDLDHLEKALESCLYEEWEEFRLISRDDTVWDEICQALIALDRDHHQLLRQILEQCAAMSTEWIEDNGGLYHVLSSDEMLEHDVRGERDDRRARKGYVSAADAKAFLALAHDGSAQPSTRDAITNAYFRELSRPSPNSTPGTKTSVRPSGPARPSGGNGTALLQLLARARVIDVAENAKQLPRALSKRSTSRRNASKAPSTSTPPSTSTSMAIVTESAPRTRLLERALSELHATEPCLYEQRMEELGFLANVLVAAPKRARQQLRPIEALEAAVEVVNLALEQLVEKSSRPSAESTLAAQAMLRSTSLDCLFRTAYPSLCTEANASEPTLERLRKTLVDLAPRSRAQSTPSAENTRGVGKKPTS